MTFSTMIKMENTGIEIEDDYDALNIFKENFPGLTLHKSVSGLKGARRYFDPAGYMGEPIDMRKGIYNINNGMLEHIGEEQERGNDLNTAIFTGIVKGLTTSSWTVPIHAFPGVRIIDPTHLPLANMIPRVAVNRVTLQVTPLSTVQLGGYHAQDGTYYEPSADDVYYGGTASDYSYTVSGYSRLSRISELFQMTSQIIDNPMQVTLKAAVTGMRKFEERQIIQGTSGDANSWDGLEDLCPAASETDYSGAAISLPGDLTTIITDAVRRGANWDSLVIIVGWTMYRDIMNSFLPYERRTYEGPLARLGFKGMQFDEVPIFPSTYCPDTAGSREVYCVDLSQNYMAMVQDVSLQPLPKSNARNEFAVKAYGCLVSENRPGIQRFHTIA